MRIWKHKKRHVIYIETGSVSVAPTERFLELRKLRARSVGLKKPSMEQVAGYIEENPDIFERSQRWWNARKTAEFLTDGLYFVSEQNPDIYKRAVAQFGLDGTELQKKLDTFTRQQAREYNRKIHAWCKEQGYVPADPWSRERKSPSVDAKVLDGMPPDAASCELRCLCRKRLTENLIQLATTIEENFESVLNSWNEGVRRDYTERLASFELGNVTRAGTAEWLPNPEDIRNIRDYWYPHKLRAATDYPWYFVVGDILWYPKLKFGVSVRDGIVRGFVEDTREAHWE
jgi:hypothetical protein